MAISKAKQKKAKINKELFLTGKPFLLPRRLDIHRHPFQVHLNKDSDKELDAANTFITAATFGSDHFSGNATGRLWLYLNKRWLNQTMKSQVAFHELDFDITVDNYYAYKEIDGEQVKCQYGSGI